jgi:hypothetical protein
MTMSAAAVHTDFVRAFTPGTVFRDSKGNEYPVRQLDAGELVLPTGRIVACDPGFLQVSGLDRYQPFTRTVPPGRYPVVLCLSKHTYPSRSEERVAAAMIRFTDADPVAWEMALLPGQDPSTLAPGRFFGYGVDSGRGCFTDAHAVAALEPERQLYGERCNRQPPPNAGIEYYRNLQTPFFRRLDEGWREWAASAVADPDTGANLIAFPSGWGDGGYASSWGLDRAGNPCRLATDFGILLEAFEATATFPLAGSVRTFRDPELAARGVTAVHVTKQKEARTPPALLIDDPPFDYRLTVEVRLEGAAGCVESPQVRAGGRKYGARMSSGDTYWIYLDQPLPADAELVLSYLDRTVPL